MSILKIISKDFDIEERLSEEELRNVLIDAFAYLIDNDFPKLIQILYKADVDQYKLKELLETVEGSSAAEVIADTYMARQKAKVETWEKYSRKN
ncbi:MULTISPECIES: hypothetical protein [unclassified Pedobacter]|jgi:hypothetical protein|uniref:hypothetical protein n=1 Tax=unclassified Pedobacter TaxID=2628915 RepID=UPI000B4B4D0E|nr:MULTISPECIES: hypothetical protein [unclassified Pedobacter]MCX2429765.1 hypothetical protein [Pedobacter sp. GR22-10]OWK70764.1 hypothetical protein CBW18_06590 [Pedobacter sp. AJM]